MNLPLLSGGLGSLCSNPADSAGSKFSGEFKPMYKRTESVIVDNEKELLEKIKNVRIFCLNYLELRSNP
jgi:hypothetical protein